MPLINGEKGDAISIFDRGFCYGDGFFETIYCKDNVLQNWSYHWNRMRKSAQRLHLSIPDEAIFLEDFEKLEKELDDNHCCVVKIIVTRGAGGRGYSGSQCKATTRVMFSAAMPNYQALKSKGVKAAILSNRLQPEGDIAGLKHLNRLNQILLKVEAEEKSIDEGIVCNLDGYVREGISSNLFIVQGTSLITPPLDDCGVEGTVRNKLIDIASDIFSHVRIENFTPEQLHQADEVFFTNSLMGICPVREVDQTHYPSRPMSQQLMDLHLETNIIY